MSRYVEELEPRQLLAVNFANIADAEMVGGKDLFVALDATDDDAHAIAYTATSSDPTVTAEILTGNRTLVMNVSGVDAADQAFTGDIFIEAFESLAPIATGRIIQLALSGFYDGITFHRVIDDFVAQGGDPSGTGAGGTGVEFSDEYDPRTTFSSPGIWAMANRGDDTNDSQFFLVDLLGLAGLPQHLNFNHPIIGILKSGFDTFEKIITTPTAASAPINDVTINSVDVIEDDQRAVLRLSAPDGYMGTADISVTADNGNGDMEVQMFETSINNDTVDDRAFLGDVSPVQTDEDSTVHLLVEGFDLEGDELTFVVRDPDSFAGSNSTGTEPENVSVNIDVTPGSVNGLAFAQALHDAGTRFFGAFWCPLCQEQKDLFGPDVFDNPEIDDPYVECSEPDHSTNATCTAEGITQFPTWEFPDGTRLVGVQSLETLAKRSEITLPKTETRATISFTPDPNFNGTIDMVVGVRDQTQRGGTSIDSRTNFDTQAFQLTVLPVNDAPFGMGETLDVPADETTGITLFGDDGDPDEDQTVTYSIVEQPMNGMLLNFDPATGTVDYSPTAGFMGTDRFIYRVHDDGGTADGGVDTGIATAITLNVGTIEDLMPTNVRLMDTSDDGLFDDDNVTTLDTIDILLDAPAGSTVDVTVNGLDPIQATEIAPGEFQVTVTSEQMQLGENTVTAVASTDSATSDPTDPMTFIFNPPLDEVFTVPGLPGTMQTLQFDWVSRQAAYDNEIGLFFVDDLLALVDGVAPGDDGYAEAALRDDDRQVIFRSGTDEGASREIVLPGGQQIGFYMVANNETSRFLDRNPENDRSGPKAYFRTAAANPDGQNHARSYGDALGGQLLMHWEDMFRGGDGDFNDAVISVKMSTDPSEVGEAVRVPGGTSVVTNVEVELIPTSKSASSPASPDTETQGEIGAFVVDDAGGAVGGVQPDDPGYVAAVAASATREVLFSNGSPVGSVANVAATGGSLIGFYYALGGSLDDIATANPTNDHTIGPVALFSFDAANPGMTEHFRWFGPERIVSTALPEGERRLHIMDELFGDDDDFDDLLLRIDVLA